MKHFSFWLVVCFVLGLSLRAGLAAFCPASFLFPDSQDYHQIALNCLNGQGLILSPDRIAFRPPLYPLLLACFYFFGLSLAAIRIVQATVCAGFIIIQYHLAWKISGRKDVAFLSTCLFSIDPFQMVASCLILTDGLFIGLLLGIMLLYCSARPCSADVSSGDIRENGTRNARPKRYVMLWVGLLVGVACLCRDGFLPFIPFMLLIVLALHKGSRFRDTILLAACSLLVIAPWTFRNWLHTGRLIPVTTKTGYNLYESLGPGATGGIRFTQMKVPAEVVDMPYLDQEEYLAKWTIRYVLSHPGEAFGLIIPKMARFWNPGLNNADMKSHKMADWLVTIFTLFVYLFAIIGLISSFRCLISSSRWEIAPLLIPVVYFTLVHCIFLGSVRYRIPIMPYLEIMAGYGIAVIWQKFGKKQRAGTSPTSAFTHAAN